MLMSAGLPVSANAINKDVGVHTKVCLNVRLRVVSPARIAERTASPEIRLKLYHTSGLRGSHQPPERRGTMVRAHRADFAREWANAAYDKGETQIFYSESSSGSAASGGAPSRSCWKSADTLELSGRARTTACNLHPT